MGGTSRRRFLRSVAAAGAAVGLAGCRFPTGDGRDGDAAPGEAVGTPDPVRATVREEGRAAPVKGLGDYETVVDLVAAGADPDGEEPIDAVLERVLADDTLVTFPPGRYRIDGPISRPSFEGLGLLGRDATLVPGPDASDVLFTLGRAGRASGLRFSGFEFDFADRDSVPRPFILRVDDGLLVRDVSVAGTTRAARVDVADAAGTGLVERLLLPGSPPDAFAVGCLVTDLTRGALTFRDCHVHGFPNNGLYASPSHGPVRVIGGSYVDNGIANVRVGGQSVVRGVRVACDNADDRFRNARGIWVRHGREAVVEDCDVHLRRVHSSDGAITVGGAGELRDVRVRVDADGVAALNVRGQAADDGADQGSAGEASEVTPVPGEPTAAAAPPGVDVSNFTVTGTAATASAVRITDREGCSFEGLSIHQSGGDRDGVTAVRAGAVGVRGGEVAVTGRPFHSRRASIDVSDVETRTLTPSPSAD